MGDNLVIQKEKDLPIALISPFNCLPVYLSDFCPFLLF